MICVEGRQTMHCSLRLTRSFSSLQDFARSLPVARSAADIAFASPDTDAVTGTIRYHCMHCSHISLDHEQHKQHEAQHRAQGVHTEAYTYHQPQSSPYGIHPCESTDLELQMLSRVLQSPLSSSSMDGSVTGSVALTTAAMRSGGCPYCNFMSPDPLVLSSHVHSAHSSANKPYSCPVCSRGFSRKNNLQVHMRIHTGEKPFGCPHCSYRSSQKSNLKLHILSHSEIKPYACPYCDHRSSQKINLKMHVYKKHPALVQSATT
jgi:KRAB domain-containing zinc finger protein